MAKCQWSIDGICQCFINGQEQHPSCDGQHKMPCNQGNLDLVDIRFRQAKKNPGRGGHRVGAGAPRGNLNAIKSGIYSQQLKHLHQEETRILRAARERRAHHHESQQMRKER